ncbi:MAG: hypothetical protein JF606_18955 [Burkholderiales bacterium]|nr:hypothetical protein [Burkholderiales bacterium]
MFLSVAGAKVSDALTSRQYYRAAGATDVAPAYISRGIAMLRHRRHCHAES